ncbi:MAG: hypothetical protein HYU66_13125 [Armatimonadetes bacterium]|nr:hypothetical protein [Armatimonadota bacterium]
MLALLTIATAASADQTVFQVGRQDGSYRDLALGVAGYAGYSAAYPGDINVDAQAPDAAAHFPYIQPSDHDGWAGARQHPVALKFQLADAPHGSYRLTVALVAAHWGWPPVLVAEIGGEQRFACLPAFEGDDRVLADPASAQPFVRELWFAATALRQGDNTLTLRTVSGSWLLYDAVKLDQVDGSPQPEAERIFRIGRHDHNYRELRLAAEGFPAFNTAVREPIVVEAQGPHPEQELPYILPGPGDSWAGGRTHPVELRFKLDKVPDSDGCLLVDLVAAHGTVPPDLRVEINGAATDQPLPAGPGDKVLSDPSAGRQQIIAVPFPAGCFREGENRLVLTALRGSWLLFDAVDLLLTGSRRPPMLANLRLAVRPVRLRGTAAGGHTVRLSASYWGPTTDASLELDLAGTRVTRPVPGLHFGANQLDLALPAATQPVDAKAVLHAGALQAEATARLAPVRDLTLYVCPSIHTDIGYTNLQPECAQRHVDSLLNIMLVVHATSDYPEGSRLKWNCEVTWEAEQLERLAPQRADEFFALCRDERIGISAAYANILTGLCGHEQFCRLTYAAERLRRERGVRIRVATMTDNPSYVWSLPSVLAGSGVTYFAVGCNDSRGVFAAGNPMRPPVWWEGPDRHCALYWFGGGYGMASGLGLMDSLEAAESRVPDFAAARASDMALVYGGVGDNQVMTTDMALRLADTVRAWNEKYESPRLVLATFDEFFTEFHRRHGAETPVVRGDGGAYWEDGAGSSAHETALNRETHELLGTAETLKSWARVLGGRPSDGLWPVVRNSLLYDEHTWGAYNSITDPDSEFVKGQWAIKARFATEGHDDVRKALGAGLGALAAQVAGGATDEVLVYNQLAWERSGIVTSMIRAQQCRSSSSRTSACRC